MSIIWLLFLVWWTGSRRVVAVAFSKMSISDVPEFTLEQHKIKQLTFRRWQEESKANKCFVPCHSPKSTFTIKHYLIYFLFLFVFNLLQRRPTPFANSANCVRGDIQVSDTILPQWRQNIKVNKLPKKHTKDAHRNRIPGENNAQWKNEYAIGNKHLKKELNTHKPKWLTAIKEKIINWLSDGVNMHSSFVFWHSLHSFSARIFRNTIFSFALHITREIKASRRARLNRSLI